MSTTATLKPGHQLWGIYHTDREYARVMGDPLRTVIEAPTKLAAEEEAARLGFSEPWAHPVSATESRRAQWLPNADQDTDKNSRTSHLTASPPEPLIMQTPSTAQIRTAIEVLKRFGEHINHNAAHLIIELPETRFGDQVAARAKVVNIEQVTRIRTVAAQLEKWRSDVLQQERQGVSHHV